MTRKEAFTRTKAIAYEMDNYIVSSSPHIRGRSSTRSIMLDVMIALMPCLIAGTVFFGFRAIIVVAVTTATAVLTEYISRRIMKRPQTAGDLSAAVTGMILGLILPPECNLLIAVFGAVAAVAVVKQMFGGIGQNFANPACTARIILLVSSSSMSRWTPTVFMNGVDAVTTATPLSGATDTAYLDLFFGNTAGCIGETSVLAILIGFAYLCVRGVISPLVPAVFVGSAAAVSLFCGADVPFQLMSGGLLFGAVFMATDYTTSPMSRVGKIIFAAGCGAITVLIRVYGNLPEGVSYAILIMNIVSPLIDRITTPKNCFGSKEARVQK